MSTNYNNIPGEKNKEGGLVWYLFNRFSFRGWIAMFVVVGTLGIIVLTYYKAVPAANKEVAYLILGALLAKFGTVVDWNFGGAKAADDKQRAEIKREATNDEQQSH